jgi:uncharacterized membrane protein
MLFKRIEKIRTWYEQQKASESFGDQLADYVANGMGSWKFIIIQTLIVAVWMILNFIALVRHWDPYPFILLNLLFSTQAAYSAPIIMMSQNRQNERDRAKAVADFENNVISKEGIENLLSRFNGIESGKLDRILTLLEKWEAEKETTH